MNNTLKDLTMKMKKEDLSNNVMILLEIINEQDQKIDKAIEYIKTQKFDFRNDDRTLFIFNKCLELLGDKE